MPEGEFSPQSPPGTEELVWEQPEKPVEVFAILAASIPVLFSFFAIIALMAAHADIDSSDPDIGSAETNLNVASILGGIGAALAIGLVLANKHHPWETRWLPPVLTLALGAGLGFLFSENWRDYGFDDGANFSIWTPTILLIGIGGIVALILFLTGHQSWGGGSFAIAAGCIAFAAFLAAQLILGDLEQEAVEAATVNRETPGLGLVVLLGTLLGLAWIRRSSRSR